MRTGIVYLVPIVSFWSFVVLGLLKVFGVIDWSWWWVFSPLFFYAALLAYLFAKLFFIRRRIRKMLEDLQKDLDEKLL